MSFDPPAQSAPASESAPAPTGTGATVATPPVASAGSPRVVLYGRIGCHLCHDVRATIHRGLAAAGLGLADLAEVDVDTDPELAARFGDWVPVVVVDGVELAHYRLDEDRFVRALQGRRGWLAGLRRGNI
jgi:hypothetical protein